MRSFKSILSVFFLLGIVLYAQPEDVHDFKYSLKIREVIKANKIKSISVFESEDSTGNKSFEYRLEFNESGIPLTMRIKEESDPDKEVSDSFYEYTYTNKNKLTEVNYVGKDSKDVTVFYGYNDDGKLDGGSFYGGEPRRFVYEYNSKNELTKEIGWGRKFILDSNEQMQEDWSPFDSTEFEFNSKGFLTKEKYFGFGNNTKTYLYDKNDNLIKVIFQNDDSKIIEQERVYYYDKKGLLIKIIQIEAGIPVKYVFYEYQY